MITRADFKKATGLPPEQDDLERCNCNQAGQLGHFHCGWDVARNLPNFWPKYPLQGAVTRDYRASLVANGARGGGDAS